MLEEHWPLAGLRLGTGVSRKLGYRRDGTSRDVLGDRVVVSDRLRLDRDDWARAPRAPVVVSGLSPCPELFGLQPAV